MGFVPHEWNYILRCECKKIYLFMALQSYVGPWLFFSFVILYTVGRIPRTGNQPVARLLPTH
jgi:hypothetical protein